GSSRPVLSMRARSRLLGSHRRKNLLSQLPRRLSPGRGRAAGRTDREKSLHHLLAGGHHSVLDLSSSSPDAGGNGPVPGASPRFSGALPEAAGLSPYMPPAGAIAPFQRRDLSPPRRLLR